MKLFNVNKNKLQTGLSAQAGMSLVELMVVLAIFMIVASITIFDYGSFRSNVSLQNLADDIALSVRRAQGFAIGVVRADNSFSNGYGIHFTTAAPTDALAGSNKSFVIFADINKDGRYNHDSSDAVCKTSPVIGLGHECYDLLTITTNDIIDGVCIDQNDTDCLHTVDITFIRPDPSATFYIDGNSIDINKVDIRVKNQLTGVYKYITVSKVGQISIK